MDSFKSVKCERCQKVVASPCYSVEQSRGCPNLTYDAVNSPAHYNAGKVEVIDYILQIAKLYPGDEAALIGNVIKYVSRAPLKGKKKEDLEKAQWYLNRLLDSLKTN